MKSNERWQEKQQQQNQGDQHQSESWCTCPHPWRSEFMFHPSRYTLVKLRYPWNVDCECWDSRSNESLLRIWSLKRKLPSSPFLFSMQVTISLTASVKLDQCSRWRYQRWWPNTNGLRDAFEYPPLRTIAIVSSKGNQFGSKPSSFWWWRCFEYK